MNRFFVSCVFFCLSTAAIAQTAYEMRTPFNEKDFAVWTGPGSATLHGQAFLKTVGGDVKTCAGTQIYLLPANAYTREMTAAEDRGATQINADPSVRSHIRTTICDAQGNFSFANVPAQSWYLVGKVTWGTPHIAQPGEDPGLIGSLLFGWKPPPDIDLQGGELRKLITLEAGDNQEFLAGEDEVRAGNATTQNANAPAPGLSSGATATRITSTSAPTLGISTAPTPTDLSKMLKMNKPQGMFVVAVTENSAAARAGIVRGDVILSGNGNPWDTPQELAATMNYLHSGDKLTLEVWSGATEKTISVSF